MRWCTPLTLTLRRQGQEDLCESEATLANKANSTTNKAAQRYPVSKKQNSNKLHPKKKRQTQETEFLSDGKRIILGNV